MGKSTGQSFRRRTDVEEFFGRKQYKGKILKLPREETSSPHIYYDHPNGKIDLWDCVNVMKEFDD